MKFALLAALLFGTNARSAELTQCGTYEMEGYYTQKPASAGGRKSQRVFVTDRATAEQMTFILENPRLMDLIPDDHLGVNFRIRLKIRSRCKGECKADLVEVIHPLPPMDTARPFLVPVPKPISGSEIACVKN